MTGGELLEKARGAWEKARPWLPYALAVVLALLLVRGCNQRRAEAAELSRLREAEQLRASGQVVVQQVPDLAPRVAALEAENAELAKALEEARRAAPGAQPVGVLHAQTAPRPVLAKPTPTAVCPPAAPPVEVAKQEVPVCVLAAGDSLGLTVDEVVLKTQGANRLIVGTAAAYREGPEPELLLRAPFSAPLTEASEKAAVANAVPGWRGGPLGVVNDRGWLLGVLLATPQGHVPLIGWGVEAQVGAAFGSGGAQGQAAVLFQP